MEITMTGKQLSQIESGQYVEIATIPTTAKAALKRLCGFYGGSENELLGRLISDLERDTLAALPLGEREDYFGARA
jgi:hypothetical protein